MDPPPPPPQQPQVGPSTYTRAPKGKACLNCRRRKLKCDCAHPVCSQCTRLGREKDCEYSDKDHRSRTEILEENIAALQARLRELEHPGQPGSSSTPLTQVSPWGSVLDDLGDVEMMDHDSLYSLPSGSNSDLPAMSHTNNPTEPTRQIAQSLIEAFLPFSSDVGFFLSTPRFLNWAASHLPPRPSFIKDDNDPLLSAVYLWGTVFTADETLKRNTDAYLAHALRCVDTAFANADARPDIIHVIQSEVLLVNYLYSAGRFADARRHSASAVALVRGCGLHKSPPSSPASSPSSSASSCTPPDPLKLRAVDPSKLSLVAPSVVVPFTLAPTVDAVEAGERVRAFWTVYVLETTWARVMGFAGLLDEDGSPGARVDVPWPMDETIEVTTSADSDSPKGTIERFLANSERAYGGVGSSSSTIVSALALRAQATTLLDRAAWLASTCSSDPALLQEYQGAFDKVDAHIESFILSLPSLASLASSPSTPPELIRSLAVTHALARVAVVQLHTPWVDESMRSAAKSISACKAIMAAIRSVPASRLGTVDPLILLLLTSSSQTIIAELVRVKGVPMYRRPVVACINPYHLSHGLDEVIALMNNMNRGSPLTALQIETVEKARAVLAGTEFTQTLT